MRIRLHAYGSDVDDLRRAIAAELLRAEADAYLTAIEIYHREGSRPVAARRDQTLAQAAALEAGEADTK